MRVKCPKCGQAAELDDQYDFVTCSYCGLRITYREYVDRLILQKEDYRDILHNYH